MKKTRSVLAGTRDFSLLLNSTPALGLFQLSNQFFSGLKQQEREAHYSFPSTADVKYVWSYRVIRKLYRVIRKLYRVIRKSLCT
jgi:hypothetical protein